MLKDKLPITCIIEFLAIAFGKPLNVLHIWINNIMTAVTKINFPNTVHKAFINSLLIFGLPNWKNWFIRMKLAITIA